MLTVPRLQHDPGGGEGGGEALFTGPARHEAERVPRRLTDEGDALMSERQQVLGGDPTALAVVDDDARQCGVHRVDQHNRRMPLREPVPLVRPQRERHDDQPIGLLSWNFHQAPAGPIGRIDVVQHDLQGRVQRGGVMRIGYTAALQEASVHQHDFVTDYVDDLANVIDMDAIRASGIKIGVDPLGGAALAYWEPLAEKYRLNLTVTNPNVDPTFRFMTVDHDGKIRMDCSSPYAMAGLVGLKDSFDIAWGNDPDADRHGIVTRSLGLLNPNALSRGCNTLFAHASSRMARILSHRQNAREQQHDRSSCRQTAETTRRGSRRFQVSRARIV